MSQEKKPAPQPPENAPDDSPEQQARRRQSPDEAVEESAELVENESRQGDNLPPQEENYGGEPDERTRRATDATRQSER